MNLNEAMHELILGKEVGRHKYPEMRLKIVDPKDYETLDKETVKRIGDTVILDLGPIEDNRFTVYGDIKEEKIYTWEVSIDDVNADDFYVYEEGKNLTPEDAYKEIVKGRKVYNDKIFKKGFYLSMCNNSPALFDNNGNVVVSNDGSTKWSPEYDEEFDNYYYIILNDIKNV